MTTRLPVSPNFVVHDAEIEALDRETQVTGGAATWLANTHLAWYLRERDTARAVALAQATLVSLPSTNRTPEAVACATRLQLTLADCARLNGQLELAEQVLSQVTLQSRDMDAASKSDACWIRSTVHGARGELDACTAGLVDAIAHANAAADTVRMWVLEAALARHTGMTDRAATHARWSAVLATGTAGLPPAAAAIVGLYTGYAAFRASDFGAAIQHFTRNLEALRAHGFCREAIVAAINTSGAFLQLNDIDGSLVWIEQALAWAQTNAWPGTHGGCLVQMGELLHKRGDLATAEQVLLRARAVFSANPSSRNYVVVCQSLAEVNLDLQRPEVALTEFDRIIKLQPFPDLALIARLGRARALHQLGDQRGAVACGTEVVALAASQGAAAVQIDALQLLARLALEAGPGATAALQHLQTARQLAQATPGYKAKADLLAALAHAYALTGAFEAAYGASQEAAAARAALYKQESTNRHQAMQVHALMSAAETEATHLRQLADAERRKALLEAESAATLTRLGRIGQELTRHLDRPAIYASLAAHIPALLDASGFEIYLVRHDGAALLSVFGLENGEPLPEDVIEMSDPVSNAARSAREQREVNVALAPDGTDPSQVPGTMRTLSALFAPLMVGDRLLGVITVQSPHANAYGPQQSQIFRSLCAYAAIALDNANAYQRLHDARSQLVAQEKLAALGALVAGVAHELNTPLGNSLLMASTLAHNAELQVQALQANAVRRSELTQFLKDTLNAADLITQGLGTAAQLISNFKQVAVDRSAEQRRLFDIAQVTQQVVATMHVSVRQKGHTLHTDLPQGIEMDSLPGPYGQVLTNLINNAMLHGFGDRTGGQMTLSLQRLPGDWVEVRFQDDGVGIDPAHAQRIFEPFFTTKFGQGGSGLGLSISYNIVTSLLGGRISMEQSANAAGTCFVLSLPLQAPSHSGDLAPEHFR